MQLWALNAAMNAECILLLRERCALLYLYHTEIYQYYWTCQSFLLLCLRWEKVEFVCITLCTPEKVMYFPYLFPLPYTKLTPSH